MTSVVANRKSDNRLLPSESDSGQKMRSMFNGVEEEDAKYAFAELSFTFDQSVELSSSLTGLTTLFSYLSTINIRS